MHRIADIERTKPEGIMRRRLLAAQITIDNLPAVERKFSDLEVDARRAGIGEEHAVAVPMGVRRMRRLATSRRPIEVRAPRK